MENYRIKVSLGRTINLGNYESGRLDVGLEADLLSMENREDGFTRLTRQLVEQLDRLEKEVREV